MKSSAVACLALIAGAAPAQVRPIADHRDPRVATLRYEQGLAAQLNVPVGGELLLLLQPDERVSSLSLGLTSDWQAIAGSTAQTVSIRPIGAARNSSFTVLTSARSYSFTLAPAPAGQALILVRILPESASKKPKAVASSATRAAGWRLSGKRGLWPSVIRDDGAKIYLEWPEKQAIPAIFAVDQLGREEMVNGYMRGTTFVIDRIFDNLRFRIDKAVAEAQRKQEKAG